MSIASAFEAVPREAFIPDTIWVRRDDGWAVPLHRKDDPDRWLAEVRSDDAITTQVDDGAADRGIWPTSSCSAPHVVRQMLELLDLQPGLRVLEIGAGTGWNAALMAQIAGTANVTTVEIDPAIAEQARRNLHRAGHPVEVVTGDGTAGHPANAPYDRVIATAAVAELPLEWVRQCRTGGLLLVPWAPTFHPDGPLALITVQDGARASGRFVAPSWFMPLRSQRIRQSARDAYKEKWRQAGSPTIDRFGLTVTPTAQHVWLDDPGNVIWPVAAGRP